MPLPQEAGRCCWEVEPIKVMGGDRPMKPSRKRCILFPAATRSMSTSPMILA